MNKRVLIKICGITSPEDGLLAAEAGADAVGFVFWAMSPRRVDVERAAAISRLLPPFVLRVGVFVDASRDEMARAADTVRASCSASGTPPEPGTKWATRPARLACAA